MIRAVLGFFYDRGQDHQDQRSPLQLQLQLLVQRLWNSASPINFAILLESSNLRCIIGGLPGQIKNCTRWRLRYVI